ncbi:YibE/F family protein [Leuconostoc miyukkimchii]|uniref:YibE/F family protein n=1 Tax=Leuconostoc miyukkimchii TaxID=910540 RepID=UPI001C7CA068|nr:YibE/F family protein [Leuconostoc miyukkimchii]
MNAIGILVIILFVLMVFVGKGQGVKAFFGLLCNFLAIFILIILINWQFNPYIVTIIMSLIILSIAIYLGSDNIEVTNTAFKTSIIVVAILMILSIVIQHFGQFQGFTTENSEELEGLSLTVGLPFGHIAMIVMVISILGAVAEAAMAISADLSEVVNRAPNMSSTSLYAHTRIIGGQILGTAINTLFFGVLGANIPLLIWFVRLRYPIAMFVNAKLLMAEVVTMLLGMLGILLSIWIAGWLIVRANIKQQKMGITHERNI